MSERASRLNQQVDLAFGVLDSANFTTIFTLFLTEVTTRMLQDTARFILFPVSGAMAAIHAILAIRQAKLNGGKNGTLLNAVIESVSALAVITAVVGGFVAASIFATVSPIIFTAIMSAKTLYHFGATCYYLGCAAIEKDKQLKAEYRAAAFGHGVATTAGALATVAVALVMIAAKPLLGILGIVSGAIGMGFALYNLINSPPLPAEPATGQIADKDKALEETNQDRLTNGAKLHQTLGAEKTSINSAANTEQPVVSSLWQKAPQLETANPQTTFSLKHA